MLSISEATVAEAIRILSIDDLSEEELDRQILELAGDPLIKTRLRDCIPEAFGLIEFRRLGGVAPRSFSAKAASGHFCSLPLSSEPIFKIATRLGLEMAKVNRPKFLEIASRGCTMDSLAKAIQAGHPVQGMVSSGPFLLGIPAEIYPKPTLWQWLFRR